MSADNGIYIAKFPDGYRVSNGAVQAIDNVDYFPEGSKERKEELKSYFGGSPLFETEDQAFNHANKLYDEFMSDEYDDFHILEYGISYIGEYELFK
jgi:hypothetical protein